ncbi:MAG TPA: metallopeptidase TldD-related protein, partial [Dongiaceae bacterium]
NRKQTSAFAGLMGQRIAAPGVTVVDDGMLPDRRGSLTVDDEGTPTSRTVLIEDGVLTGYLQDRLNARLMGMRATGNGRRQSYAHAPMPRMTNTVMLGGPHAPEEMIRSVKRGLYAVNFGGGQVDITSGKFVFSDSEAYLIEDGRVTAPVKGATLIGNGPDALTKVAMVGNDMALDPGIGTCGKNGQGVPVGVGQPTLKLNGLTIDDEGTPTQCTTLIEDGVLVGFIQDRQNARLMGMKPTGNGRRQSFAHNPMPRMTNTYMMSGKLAPGEIIASVKKGLYAVNFGGGQVDITSGKFVFSAAEAYLIEDGKLGPAVKGATLIGNGPDVLTKVSMVGNDMQLDPGIGTCGKEGQGVPVGVGQPTLKIDGLTVGGTAA